MTPVEWERGVIDTDWYAEVQAWAVLAGRLGLSLFPLNQVTFECDPAAGGDVRPRCGCTAGFSCTAIGKHPKYRGYLDSGTQGEREARLLVLAGWRNGFGVLTGTPSRALVIDCDPRNGGEDTAAELEARRGPLPKTLTVLSGSGDGGWHRYYALPAGRLGRNSTDGSLLGPGLDVKGDRGMVVWPPSLHRSGGRYSLDPAAPLSIAPLPPDLVDSLTTDRRERSKPELALTAVTSDDPIGYAQAAFNRAVESIQRQQSERNNTLNATAFALGQLVGCNLLNADEVARALIDAALRPDFPFEEARRTTFSGLFSGAALVSTTVAESIARLREATR